MSTKSTPSLKTVTSLNKIWQEVYDDTEKALRVIASLKLEAIDVQIGAVEVKDSVTDDRMTVNPDGSINVNISSSSSVTTADFFTNNTTTGIFDLTGAEDTVLSIPVPAGSTYHISSLDWLANADSGCIVRFKVLDGATLVKIIRIKQTIVGEDECGHVDFAYPIQVIGGTFVNIVCTIEKINGIASGCANAGINGYFL